MRLSVTSARVCVVTVCVIVCVRVVCVCVCACARVCVRVCVSVTRLSDENNTLSKLRNELNLAGQVVIK